MEATLLHKLYKQFNSYCDWLKKQTMSQHTRRAYKARAEQYLVFLATSKNDYSGVLKAQEIRLQAASDYVEFMTNQIGMKPNSINSALTGIDSFHQFLGFEATRISRTPQTTAPRMLTREEQVRFVRVVERSKSAKKRAIALLLFSTGIRVSECVALNLEDVTFLENKGKLHIKNPKGGRSRAILIGSMVANAVSAWIQKRGERFPHCKDKALFLNPQGKRMSSTAIYLIVQELGRIAGTEVSPYTLRHTCISNLLGDGNDISLVSGLAGHKRVRSTRKYVEKKSS